MRRSGRSSGEQVHQRHLRPSEPVRTTPVHVHRTCPRSGLERRQRDRQETLNPEPPRLGRKTRPPLTGSDPIRHHDLRTFRSLDTRPISGPVLKFVHQCDLARSSRRRRRCPLLVQNRHTRHVRIVDQLDSMLTQPIQILVDVLGRVQRPIQILQRLRSSIERRKPPITDTGASHDIHLTPHPIRETTNGAQRHGQGDLQLSTPSECPNTAAANPTGTHA